MQVSREQDTNGQPSSVTVGNAYNEDDAKFLDEGPFKGVLFASVGRVGRGRLLFPQGSAAGLLLNERVGDEVVDERRVDGGVGAGPENDAGGRDDLEGVEHYEKREGAQVQRPMR